MDSVTTSLAIVSKHSRVYKPWYNTRTQVWKKNTRIQLSVSQSTPSFLLPMTFKDLFTAWDTLRCQHTEILANNYLNWNFIQLIHTWSLHYLKAWSLFINYIFYQSQHLDSFHATLFIIKASSHLFFCEDYNPIITPTQLIENLFCI